MWNQLEFTAKNVKNFKNQLAHSTNHQKQSDQHTTTKTTAMDSYLLIDYMPSKVFWHTYTDNELEKKRKLIFC